ncbi:hypothetical protein, partial [Methylorubrum aminovorans]
MQDALLLIGITGPIIQALAVDEIAKLDIGLRSKRRLKAAGQTIQAEISSQGGWRELCGRLGDDGVLKAAYRGGCRSLPEPLSESDT